MFVIDNNIDTSDKTIILHLHTPTIFAVVGEPEQFDFTVGVTTTYLFCTKISKDGEEKTYTIGFDEDCSLEEMMTFEKGFHYPYLCGKMFEHPLNVERYGRGDKSHSLKLVTPTSDFWYLKAYDESFKLIINDDGFQDAILAVKESMAIKKDDDHKQSKIDEQKFIKDTMDYLVRYDYREKILEWCVNYLDD